MNDSAQAEVEVSNAKRANWLRLLYPRSIALIGASDTGISGGHVFRNLRDGGYSGQIVPINPRHKTVFGLPSFPSLLEAPRVDAAVLLVSRERVEDSVSQAITAGAGGVLCVTGGFRESREPQWIAVERRIAKAASAAEVPLIGPNCLGLMALPLHAMMTIAPYPWKIETGSVALIMQSGGQLLASSRYVNYLGGGVRWGFSLGNAASVSFAEVLSILAEDANVRQCVLLMEEVPHWSQFRAAVKAAQRAGLWIGAIVIGRTSVGRRAAQTHTGALTLNHNVLARGLAQLGICVAETIGALLAAAVLHARFGPPRMGGVAIAGVSGGGGGLAGDLALSRGVRLATLAPATATAIEGINPEIRTDNPLDIVNGPLDRARFRKVFDRYLADPGVSVGLYLPSQGIPDGHSPNHLELLENVADAAACGDTPVLISSIVFAPIPETHRERFLGKRNVCLLPSIEEAMDALRLWLGEAGFENGGRTDEGAEEVRPGSGPEGQLQVGNEAELKAMLVGHGCDVPAHRVLALEQVRQLTRATALPAIGLPWPLVAKGIGRRIFHKAKLGFVRMGLDTPDSLGEALQDMLTSPHAGRLEAFLIEHQLDAGTDVMISVVREPLGTVVALGEGGEGAGRRGAPAWFGIDPTPEELLSGARQILRTMKAGQGAESLAEFARRAIDLHSSSRLSLLEINPARVLPTGKVVALDAVATQGDAA